MNIRMLNCITLWVAVIPLYCVTDVFADTPLGWINSSNPAAYTTTKGELEISIAGLAVNDAIDFLNYKEELIAASGRLEGDSGNLNGSKLELHYGVTSELSLFYRRQQHSLILDLGEISSVDLIDIDKSLDTTAESAGFKWTFYRANLLNPDNRQSSASLELTGFSNKSNDFDLVLSEIRLEDLTIFFGIPQTFSVANLSDEGWKARIIYSWPVNRVGIGSIWAGYGKSSAKSGTTSDLQSITISKFFEQEFDLNETYLTAGASLITDISPRLSASLDYEYINVTDSKLIRMSETTLSNLPGFLSNTAQTQITDNHTVQARLAYWLTPRLNLSLFGKLYSNQFVGVIPHYNNPLSGSFASAPYGFAGLELTYKISR